MEFWYYRIGLLIGIWIFYKIITTDWVTLEFMAIVYWLKRKNKKK